MTSESVGAGSGGCTTGLAAPPGVGGGTAGGAGGGLGAAEGSPEGMPVGALEGMGGAEGAAEGIALGREGGEGAAGWAKAADPTIATTTASGTPRLKPIWTLRESSRGARRHAMWGMLVGRARRGQERGLDAGGAAGIDSGGAAQENWPRASAAARLLLAMRP